MNYSDYKIGTKFTSLPKSLKDAFKNAEKKSLKIHGALTRANVLDQKETVSKLIGEKYPSHLNFAGA